jgi:hypothetical protein
VPVGSRVRLVAEIAAVQELEDAEQLVVDLRVEDDAGERPVCVAQALFRHHHLSAAPT